MKLTRRDAIAALAGVGIVTASGAAALSREEVDAERAPDRPSLDETLEALVAAADVLYPADVEGVPAFVETYSLGRIQHREGYLAGVRDAAGTLDTYAGLWFDAATFAELPVADRDGLLHEMGVHTAEEQPDGTDPERVRHFVVNELLYALYTSPTGAELVGLENPPGHPGGTESYQRGPR